MYGKSTVKLIQPAPPKELTNTETSPGRCYLEMTSGKVYLISSTRYKENFPIDIVTGEMLFKAVSCNMRFIEVEAEVHIK